MEELAVEEHSFPSLPSWAWRAPYRIRFKILGVVQVMLDGVGFEPLQTSKHLDFRIPSIGCSFCYVGGCVNKLTNRVCKVSSSRALSSSGSEVDTGNKLRMARPQSRRPDCTGPTQSRPIHNPGPSHLSPPEDDAVLFRRRATRAILPPPPPPPCLGFLDYPCPCRPRRIAFESLNAQSPKHTASRSAVPG